MVLIKKAVNLLLAAGCLLIPISVEAQELSGSSVLKTTAQIKEEQLTEQIKQAQENVYIHPTDAKARYELAELLRLDHKDKEAASEYLEVVSLDPTMYVAFHRIATINSEPAQVDEAIEYLSELKGENPRAFLLCVALSELLEKRKDYYPSARILVNLVYGNVVPPRYQKDINTKIHYLLAQSREASKQEVVPVATQNEQLDTLLPPLPDNNQPIENPKQKSPQLTASHETKHNRPE